MKNFWSVVTDNETGLPIQSCYVYVYKKDDDTLATIYEDDGITELDNPFLTDENGRYNFYVDSGTYYLKFSKEGYNDWTSDPITIPDEVDETDDDTTKNKYVSNKIIKDLCDPLLTEKNIITSQDNIIGFCKDITWLIGQGGGGSGDMLKSVYDTDDDGIVDNAEKLENHPASDFLLKSTYDTDDDGIVDNAEKLENHPASDFALSSHNHSESDLSLSDVTTNNVSTSKHGFCPKAPNDTSQFLRGDGNWATVSRTRKLVFPASCFETRVASGWAEFTQVQGTNFDYGELDFDASTDEQANSPPFRMTNWNGGSITVRIGFKANATSGDVMWVVSFVGRDTSTPEAWDASFTDHALSAVTVPSTAEYLKEAVWTGTPSELANNDAVIMKITRDADNSGDTLSVDAKLLYVELQYTEE